MQATHITFLKKFLLGFAIPVAALPLIALGITSMQPRELQPPTGVEKPVTAEAVTDTRTQSRLERVMLENPQSPPVETMLELPEAHYLGEGLMMRDLRVYPILCRGTSDVTDVLTLDEALEAGKCDIHETGDVNELIATVCGDQPVLALTGDLLLGGRQDRIVARSVLLEPGITGVKVYCVEHGRWSGRIDESALEFHKQVEMPQVDLSVKFAAAMTQSQQQVWDRVADTNANLEAPDELSSGSYRNAFNTQSATEVEAMLVQGQCLLGEDVVGFAVFEGDSLVNADIFDCQGLLQKVAGKLLRSYALTAVQGSLAAVASNGSEYDAELGYVIDINESPRTNLAENVRADGSGLESPTPNRAASNSAVGLARGMGHGVQSASPVRIAEAAPVTSSSARLECRRDGQKRPVHISLFGN